MRIDARVVAVLASLLFAVAVVAEAGRGPGQLSAGSAFAVLGDGLTVLPRGASCDGINVARCPARYAFSPDRSFSMWISVRNDTPLAVTFEGVSQRWLDSLPPDPLVRPVATFDGGGERDGIVAGTYPPLRPMTLPPRAERHVVIALHTTADVATACRLWRVGTGMGFDSIPVTWRWALVSHETQIALPTPLQIAAPTDADCGR